MKISILIPALCLASIVALPATTVIFSTGFETESVGADPDGFSRSENSGTNIEVSNAQAASGTQSLFMADNSASINPNLSKDFGANYGVSTTSFSFLRSSAGDLSFRVDFFNTGSSSKNFDLLLSGSTQGTITIRNSGGTNIATSGSLAAFNPDVWNIISMELDETAGTANVFLNGNKVIDNYTNAGIAWNLGKIQMNMGFSSATGREGYIDDVSFAVPEPSSALLVLSTLALGFTRRRR